MAEVNTIPLAYVATGVGPDLKNEPGPGPRRDADGHDHARRDDHLQDQPRRGVVGQRADHVRRLRRTRRTSSRTARTSTTAPATSTSTSVTCPDPKTVVVKYKPGKTFASWQSLFAGSVGIMPSHILKGKDRDALMKDGYTWSGGPWFAKWNKGDSIVLTPNAELLGHEAEARQGDVQVPGRHVGRVPGVQVGSGLDDLPAAAARRRRRDRPGSHRTPTPSTTRRRRRSRRCGSTTRRRRSTPRSSVRRSPTRSTATRS